MATLHFTPSPSFVLTRHKLPTELSSFKLNYKAGRSLKAVVRSYRVVIEHEGQSTELEVEPDETILSKALDSGLTVPHDCKLGVCMTCPAKLISGSVDQSDGMLSDDVVERGYALLCAALFCNRMLNRFASCLCRDITYNRNLDHLSADQHIVSSNSIVL